jgi:hypothetical protein
MVNMINDTAESVIDKRRINLLFKQAKTGGAKKEPVG